MLATSTLVAFVGASLAVNVYPGPNNLFALSNGARYGLGPAMAASLGRQLAFALLVATLAMGLGAHLLKMPALFLTLKVAGALFLGWRGCRMLARPTEALEFDTPASTRRAALFRDEFCVAFANPKPLLVLLPFLPQLVAPGEVVSLAVALCGSLFLALEALAALAYAVAGRRLDWIATTARGRLWLNRAGGLSVILAALLLVLPR